MIFFLLLIAGAIFLINIFIWRDFRSPALIHSGIWLSILGLHTFVPHGLYQLSEEVVMVVVTSIVFFSLGSAFSMCIIPSSRTPSSLVVPSALTSAGKIYYIISVVGGPFFLAKAIDLASHGITDNFLINLRISLTYEDYKQSFGVFGYLAPIAYTGFFIKLVDRGKRLISPDILLPFLVCVFYAILSTGRTFLFLLIIPAFVIILFTRPGVITVKNIIIFTGLLGLSFFSIGAVMGKLGGDDGDLISVVWLYLLGGISAFDSVLHGSFHQMNGVNTFRSFLSLFAAIGFDVPVIELIQDYAYIPLPTNVYTVFFPYFVDFGIYAIFLMQFVFGMAHGVLYFSAVRGSAVFIILFSIGIYPLFMQWFQDQYFLLLTTWIVFAVLILIPSIVPRRISELVKK